MSAEEVQALMASADSDGLLDEEEFLRLVREAEAGHEEEENRCREAFRMYEM